MDDLKIIKDKYGEKMMHLCRTLFPTLLDMPGILSKVMLEHFEPSRFLYDDIINSRNVEYFSSYIYSFVDMENKDTIALPVSLKTPFELLSDAGYDLYECKNEDDIQAFRKYYEPNEELCTFNGGRLDRCYVFFAVKKNVSEIKRENFPNPQREDEYGTSVISIQFTRGDTNVLSIKNRYNQHVDNPDNTFDNNLDNIIVGLTNSFQRDYNLNFDYSNENLKMKGYVYIDYKFYKYNHKINNICYGPNNIIIDNFRYIDKYSKEPERYIVLDYFILDLKEKTIELYDKSLKDSFVDEFKNIEKINVLRDKKTGNRTIEINYDSDKKAIIVIDKTNQIIGYQNEFLTKIGDDYLCHNSKLITFKIPNVVEMGDNCLNTASRLRILEISNLQVMGDSCFKFIRDLTDFDAPNLIRMGNNCLHDCWELTSFKVPNLLEMGKRCLYQAMKLKIFEAPRLLKMGSQSVYAARNLMVFEAPKLLKIGSESLSIVPSEIENAIPTYSGLKRIQQVSKLLAYNLNKMIKETLFEIKQFRSTTEKRTEDVHRK